jgi:hypothetical protein
VELAGQHEEELVGVVVDVPDVVAQGVGYADVVVVHRGDDAGAVDVVEGRQCDIEVDRVGCASGHEPILARPVRAGL